MRPPSILPYWRDRHRAQADWIRQVEQELRLQLTTYAPVFQYFQKMPAVCLSMSLTRNGRGYTDLSGRFGAAAPLPQREEDIPNAFFTLLHEFTHQFTDDLLEMDINMRDGSHNLAENAVIVTDCELVEAIAPASLTAYLLWLGSLSGHDTAPSAVPAAGNISSSTGAIRRDPPAARQYPHIKGTAPYRLGTGPVFTWIRIEYSAHRAPASP